MTQDSKRIPPAPCPGDPHNCELLLSSQQAYHGRGAQAEISGHEAIVSAMAVGLVIDVWRNGPAEDMHCGKRGPDDAAMFAESTSLHDRAVTALTAGNRPIGLLEFEDHLLDRQRPWAGTGGKTLNRPRLRLPRTVPPAREGPHQQAAGPRPSHLHRRPARTSPGHHRTPVRPPSQRHAKVARHRRTHRHPPGRSSARRMGTRRPRRPGSRGNAAGDALARKTHRCPPERTVQPSPNSPGMAESPSAVLRGATIRPAVGRAIPQNLTALRRHCRQIISGGA